MLVCGDLAGMRGRFFLCSIWCEKCSKTDKNAKKMQKNAKKCKKIAKKFAYIKNLL